MGKFWGIYHGSAYVSSPIVHSDFFRSIRVWLILSVHIHNYNKTCICPLNHRTCTRCCGIAQVICVTNKKKKTPHGIKTDSIPVAEVCITLCSRGHHTVRQLYVIRLRRRAWGWGGGFTAIADTAAPRDVWVQEKIWLKKKNEHLFPPFHLIPKTFKFCFNDLCTFMSCILVCSVMSLTIWKGLGR